MTDKHETEQSPPFRRYCPVCGKLNATTGTLGNMSHYCCEKCEYQYGVSNTIQNEPPTTKVWEILHALMKSEFDLNTREKIDKILSDYMPSGSGFDTDWKVCVENGTPVIFSAYHVMHNGFYVGWLPFQFTIKEEINYDRFDIDPTYSQGILDNIEEDTGNDQSFYTDYIEDMIVDALRVDYKEKEEA